MCRQLFDPPLYSLTRLVIAMAFQARTCTAKATQTRASPMQTALVVIRLSLAAQAGIVAPLRLLVLYRMP